MMVEMMHTTGCKKCSTIERREGDGVRSKSKDKGISLGLYFCWPRYNRVHIQVKNR
jgi:hypothetical protein